MTPRRTALAVMAVALLTGGCATAGSGDPPGQLSGRLDDGGVAVVATLVSEPDGTWRVRATFAPQKTGYHLYSMDLPPDGVDGLGVPTTVAVLGSLRAAGSPTTDVPVKALRIPSLDVDLPVYPDGPVTVTVPVRRIGHGRAEVAVSYAACSPANCLAPVRDRIIALAPG